MEEMNKIEIEIGKELGRFVNKLDWINRAEIVYKKAYQKIGSRDVITVDNARPRRIMQRGLHFKIADEQSTFPVVIYALSSNT